MACEAEIAQSAEISAMRALQSEQNAAYLKSLEIDKEKMGKKRSLRSSESDCNDEITPNISSCDNKLKERISKALLDLEDEPILKEGNFRFQFFFPDGTRKIRSFPSNATTKVKVKQTFKSVF